MKTFYRLEEAREFQSLNKHLFATDVNKSGSKRYHCLTYDQAYQYVTRSKSPTLYEMMECGYIFEKLNKCMKYKFLDWDRKYSGQSHRNVFDNGNKEYVYNHFMKYYTKYIKKMCKNPSYMVDKWFEIEHNYKKI